MSIDYLSKITLEIDRAIKHLETAIILTDNIDEENEHYAITHTISNRIRELKTTRDHIQHLGA